MFETIVIIAIVIAVIIAVVFSECSFILGPSVYRPLCTK